MKKRKFKTVSQLKKERFIAKLESEMDKKEQAQAKKKQAQAKKKVKKNKKLRVKPISAKRSRAIKKKIKKKLKDRKVVWRNPAVVSEKKPRTKFHRFLLRMTIKKWIIFNLFCLVIVLILVSPTRYNKLLRQIRRNLFKLIMTY